MAILPNKFLTWVEQSLQKKVRVKFSVQLLSHAPLIPLANRCYQEDVLSQYLGEACDIRFWTPNQWLSLQAGTVIVNSQSQAWDLH